MSKFWRVVVYEYTRNVFKKSFILSLVSVPLMIALNIGVGFFMETARNNDQPVGYVDQAGVLANALPAPLSSSFDKPVEFIAFQSEADARAALEAGQIQAYYLISEDYLETRHIALVFFNEPGENAAGQFYDFLQINLLASKPPEVAARVAGGSNVTVRSMDGRREVPGGGPTFGLLMPLLTALAFLALILMSSGYLMAAVADEKENRTMEILVTSASPLQIIVGKVVGIVAIGFTLLAAWVGVTIAGILIANSMGIGWFQDMQIDWSIILSAAGIAIPAYIFVAALMTTVGAMVTSIQEGGSLSSIFVLLHLVPFYISWIFINDPNSPLAVILSILPFTSLMTVAMRNLFSAVPVWQVLISVCVQVICAAGALWLAARAFRLGMLRYGQRLQWRSLFTFKNP